MKKSTGRWQVVVIIIIAVLLAFATVAVLSDACNQSATVVHHFFGS